MDEHCVFAYGSNMDALDLGAWFERQGLPAPVVRRRGLAALRGYHLAFNYHSQSRRSGAANVEPLASACQSRGAPDGVHGLLLWVDTPTLRGLDSKEGHPGRYQREQLSVHTSAGEERLAWVYRVTQPFRQSLYVAPSKAYMALITGAAQRHDFPAAYLAWLQSLPCSSGA